jgi:5'-3' exonuclease
MQKPKPNKLPVGIDADIISYRCAWSTEGKTREEAKDKVDEVVGNIIYQICGDFPDSSLLNFYLTGRNNFRHSIAKTAPYKGNRKDTKKPEHIGLIRDYLVSEYKAEVVDGKELDDAVATQAREFGYSYIVASTDKDFMQLPCWIYNWGKGEWYKPSEFEASKFFYTQILTGDSVDNIIGLYGIGPVKAGKLLEDCASDKDMWEVCLKAYDHDVERVLENARLLWLQRHDGEMWEPPIIKEPTGNVFEDKDC